MSLTKEDLQAIKGVVNEAVQTSETRLTGRIDEAVQTSETRLTKRIEASETNLAGIINDLASNIDERFAKVDEQFSAINDRFTKIDRQFEQADEKLDHVRSELRQDIATMKRELLQEMQVRDKMHDEDLTAVANDVARLDKRVTRLEQATA